MTKKSVSLFTLLLSLLASPIFADNKPMYTMQDLQKLSDISSWRELVDHLEDIPPSQRNEIWNKLAEKAGIGLLSESANKPNPIEGVMIEEDLIRRYPTLKESKAFMAQRADVGLKLFDKAMSEDYVDPKIIDELRSFVEDDPKNTELAWKAGKLARLRMNAAAAVPFFKKALHGSSDPKKCGDQDVQLAVVAGLGLPKDTNAEIVADSREIASGACFSALRKTIRENFADSNDYYKQNSCDFLKAKKVLNSAQISMCPSQS